MDPESVEESWEFYSRMAVMWDEKSRASTTIWIPPIMSALIEAARVSALGRYHPVTSHRQLWFSTSPRHWTGDGVSLPVVIAPMADGRYRVETWSGDNQPSHTVLETADATAAVAAAVEHVEQVGWVHRAEQAEQVEQVEQVGRDRGDHP